MKKILVTTDMSAKSKAGLRFAIQLASQHKYELTFLYVHYIMKPSSWHEKTFAEYEKNLTQKMQLNLNRFVDSIYKSMKVSALNKKSLILYSFDAAKNIKKYAARNNFNFICLSTRGAGKLKKLFGTITSNLINFSEIPIIAVPH